MRTATSWPPDSAGGKNPEAEFLPFECVAIVGVGLMGGSLGLALRARGLAKRVVGIGRNAEALARAVEIGAIDAGTTDLAFGVREADAVTLCVPVRSIPSLLETIAPEVRPDALVTDLGSTKATIVAAGTRWLGDRFVGSHPMAGSEQSGIEAARADLYVGAAWAVVRSQPFDLRTDPHAARIAGLASAVGARPVLLQADIHDHLVALVSHLPHVISYAFARAVSSDPDAREAREIAAGSYRDMMRVSHSDPRLWRDIFLDNRDALLAIIAAFEGEIQAMKAAVATGDEDALLTLLTPRA